MDRPNTNDVARFVSDYMSGAVPQMAPSGDLLHDIAKAYVAARGLDESWVREVIPMIDNAL